MFKISDLNKKIEIQSESKIDDGFGGFLIERTNLKTVWAKIETINFKLKNEYKILEIECSYLITVRKLNKIDNNMIIVYNNKKYSIKYIDDSDKNFLKIFC